MLISKTVRTAFDLLQHLPVAKMNLWSLLIWVALISAGSAQTCEYMESSMVQSGAGPLPHPLVSPPAPIPCPLVTEQSSPTKALVDVITAECVDL